MGKRLQHAGGLQRAGALVGQGAYGCTFLPAVPCADKSGKSHPIKPNRIGKVFGRYQSAAEELVFARIVKKIDPQQRLFYYPDESCFANRQDVERELVRGDTCDPMKALPATENKAIELLMPNGGQTLTEYLKTKGLMSRAAMAAILERLFFGVRRLLEAGYVHQDLKTPNIVAFAGPNGGHEVRIIDFGNISSFADFYDSDTNFMMEGHRYFVNPPEYRIPLKLDEVRLQVGSNGTSVKDYATVVAEIFQIETRIVETIAIPDIQASYRVGYVSSVRPQPDYIQHNVMALERFCAMFDGLDYDGRMKVLEGMNAASKADMWSMGTIMILLDRYLIPATQDDAEAVNIYGDMVSGLLQPNPAERMSIDEALRLIRRLKKTGILGSPVQNDHYQAVFRRASPVPAPPTLPLLPTHPVRPVLAVRAVGAVLPVALSKRPLTGIARPIVPMPTRMPKQKVTQVSQSRQSIVASNQPIVNQASKASPTPKTKLSKRLHSSTVRDLRASDIYKQLPVSGKSRFKKDELIRAIVKNAIP